MDIYDKVGELKFKDPGKGIVGGFKEGDAADIMSGVFGAGLSMLETMVPAYFTGGLSLIPQIGGPMYFDYNETNHENFREFTDNVMSRIAELSNECEEYWEERKISSGSDDCSKLLWFVRSYVAIR